METLPVHLYVMELLDYFIVKKEVKASIVSKFKRFAENHGKKFAYFQQFSNERFQI